MTPQELKEELIFREAYAIGYKNGSTDTILTISKKMQEKQEKEKIPNIPENKEVQNGNN